MFSEPWRIELLGRLSAQQAGRVITRFQTQKTASLFAYLAYFQSRHHPREELIDRFWPEAAPEAGRTSLRTALASLRRQLEPPGVPAGSVLIAERAHIRLNPEAVRIDVDQFQQALQAASRRAPEEQIEPLIAAVDLYTGELLPGFYDDWALSERERLADAYLGALRLLTRLLAQAKEFQRALEYARRAVSADPLREESHRNVMRLYAALGRPAAALQQYEEMERLLDEKLGMAPSAATRDLVKELQASVPHAPREGRRTLPEEKPAGLESFPSVSAPIPRVPETPRLPLQFTRFFGREEESARLLSLLQPGDPTGRLLTLTGPGGAGKTRLAIEIAGKLQERFGSAIWFVPLADLADARRITGAILDALPLTAVPDTDPLEQIIAFLQAQPSLLILDNFEQLAETGARIVKELLARTPTLTCLVTSRQRLNLAGEREITLAPLPTPSAAGSPEQLVQWPSVALFVDRAQAHRQDFQVTRGNAAAVAALCQRLEGLPLAIELAAAWAQTLTPAQMLERLSRRFEILVSRRKDMEDRHRTLRAAIEWSYQMLSPPLQTLFARLSLFRGGWTAEAADAIFDLPLSIDDWKSGAGLIENHPSTIENDMLQLRERSLIVAEDTDGVMRFRMLESLRQFADEMLTEENREQTARRHAAYFLTLAVEAGSDGGGRREAAQLERLEAERDNLRAALEWCQATPDSIEMGLQAAIALQRLWLTRGPAGEGRECLAGLLARVDESLPGSLHAQALGAASSLAEMQGDLATSRAFCEQSLALYRALGDTQGIAVQLNNLAIVADQQGDYTQAHSLCEEALAQLSRTTDKAAVAQTFANLGVIARHQGDYDRARAYYTESLAVYREIEDYRRVATVLHNLGVLAGDRGEDAQARRYLEESVAIKRELGNKRGIAYSLGPLAGLAFKQEDYALACALYTESLRAFREVQDQNGILHCLEGLVETFLRIDQPERAVRLLSVLEAQRALSETAWSPQEESAHAGIHAEARTALGAERFAEIYDRASAMTLEQAITDALSDQRT
ncbi:MAG TPA: tetratricopeptide repeat protein [Chthonomonadaceae bacterium]|nr:tetratricopeptide repeat protein [Chthonomonadaceae bacterium]